MAIRIDEYGHIIRDDNPTTYNSNGSVQSSGANQFRAPNANASYSYTRGAQTASRSTSPISETTPVIPNSILALGIVSLASAATYYLSSWRYLRHYWSCKSIPFR